MNKLAVIVVMLLFALPVWAQTSVDDVHIEPRVKKEAPKPAPLPAPEGSLIKVNVNLVLVPVTVTNRETEAPVVGLVKGHFKLLENGKEQEIRYFSTEDSPVSMGIIFDSSGSVGTKLDMQKAAVRMLCQNANPQDELFIINFSDTINEATDFSQVTNDIESKLAWYPTKGRTALWDAVYLGISKMRAARYDRKVLIIVSDGGDNHSRYTENDIKHVLKEADILVYSIGIFNAQNINIDPATKARMLANREQLAIPSEELRGPEELQEISEASGGRMLLTMDQRDLIANIEDINTLIRHQYILGYTPHKMNDDGKYRKVKVKLQRLPKGLPFLRVDARNGFYARIK